MSCSIGQHRRGLCPQAPTPSLLRGNMEQEGNSLNDLWHMFAPRTNVCLISEHAIKKYNSVEWVVIDPGGSPRE